jgi:hypothetical protein
MLMASRRHDARDNSDPCPDADQGLRGGDDGRRCVAVISVSPQSCDVGHELTAFRAKRGRGDTDLTPNS